MRRGTGFLIAGFVLLAGCSSEEVLVAHSIPLAKATVVMPEARLLDVGVAVFDSGVPEGEVDKEVLEDAHPRGHVRADPPHRGALHGSAAARHVAEERQLGNGVGHAEEVVGGRLEHRREDPAFRRRHRAAARDGRRRDRAHLARRRLPDEHRGGRIQSPAVPGPRSLSRHVQHDRERSRAGRATSSAPTRRARFAPSRACAMRRT